MRKKAELGTSIREEKINYDIIEALRKKQISRNIVMKKAKLMAKIASKPDIKKKQKFCRDVKKEIYYSAQNVKIPFYGAKDKKPLFAKRIR